MKILAKPKNILVSIFDLECSSFGTGLFNKVSVSYFETCLGLGLGEYGLDCISGVYTLCA